MARGLSKEAEEAAKVLRKKATITGIRCDHLVKFGDVDTISEELNREVRRAEFAVADVTVGQKEMASHFAIPIFSVVSNSLNSKGGSIMANEQSIQKKKPWAQTVGYGTPPLHFMQLCF